MKVVLVLVAIYALWWLLRRSFGPRPPRSPPSAAPLPPQPVVACAYCGVHLPRDEMLAAPGGVFCGEAHRAAFDQARSGA